jgi:LPXTG-site transpeptidase (sortase) family protein
VTAATDPLTAVGDAWNRVRSWVERHAPRARRVAIAAPPSPAAVFLSYVLSALSALLVLLILNVAVVGQIQHFTAQGRLYDDLRLGLAQGSLPVGQSTIDGRLVQPGTPLALVSIPELGVHEVVVEGTSSAQTKDAVGHRRDTVLPGQVGVSVLMGRAAAYGGVFGSLDELVPGERFTITTGQGEATFVVAGIRRDDAAPTPLAASRSRVVLTSAYGLPYAPAGVIRVDADLVGTAFDTPAAAVIPGSIPDSEGVFGLDTSVFFALSWLLELLVIVVVAAIWAWRRWRRPMAWLVFAPVVTAVALAVADQTCHLLPNIL